MIVFGCAVSEPEPYVRYAEPGIKVAAEQDSEILALAAVDTIARSYNLLLDEAARRDDLEALVLVHPHAEIADPGFCEKLRAAFSDPEVAVVGSQGARGVRSIAWWDGSSVSCGPVIYQYNENGGGELSGVPWRETEPAPAEVEAVDGFLMVLSPWAVRNVRFDEGLVLGHGYDVDYCMQVRSAGRRVRTAALRVIEHRSVEVIGDVELWTESHVMVGRKWSAAWSGDGRDAAGGSPEEREAATRHRARRAEAEREAWRAVAYFKRLGLEARVQMIENEAAEMTQTTSWRVTEPLRRVNKWRRDRASRAAASTARID